MKKKTIVALAFCVLILATIIFTAAFATETYRAEKNSPTINILEGLGAVVVAIFGSIIVFYGCDLFYTVYYLLCELKRKAKTVLVILANLTWLLSFAYFYLFGEQCVYGTAEVCVHTARSFCRLHCFENCRVVFPSEGPG